jgi:hypothetical protein
MYHMYLLINIHIFNEVHTFMYISYTYIYICIHTDIYMCIHQTYFIQIYKYLCIFYFYFSQILPGKVEFDYLPINCQSVLILPVNNGAVKILKLKDLNRIRSLVAIFKNLMSSSQF